MPTRADAAGLAKLGVATAWDRTLAAGAAPTNVAAGRGCQTPACAQQSPRGIARAKRWPKPLEGSKRLETWRIWARGRSGAVETRGGLLRPRLIDTRPVAGERLQVLPGWLQGIVLARLRDFVRVETIGELRPGATASTLRVIAVTNSSCASYHVSVHALSYKLMPISSYPDSRRAMQPRPRSAVRRPLGHRTTGSENRQFSDEQDRKDSEVS